MKTKQISVFMENRPNALADFCHVLEESNINMRAMCLADTKDFGILRIIVDDAYNALTTLKDKGFVCALTDVITVEVDDKAGALVHVLDILGGNNINVEYSYAFLAKAEDKAYIILRVADTDEAIKILAGTDVALVGQDELKELFN